jgi:hypothetical protein
LLAAAAVWAVALIRTENLNYAVFKLGAWLAPGIVVLGFLFATTLSGQWQRLATSVAVVFAVARLAAALYGGHEVLGLGRLDVAALWPRIGTSGDGCQVRVDTSTIALTAGGIAASAAPLYGCELVPSS